MCLLCERPPDREHWTDAPPAGTTASVLAGEDVAGPRRRERLERVRAANRVLALRGLRLADLQGRGYALRDGKGRTALVADLGALWVAADGLAAPLDPLDPALVAALGP